MQIIPAIDILDGRCVRLHQGNFDRETRYSNDPVSVAQRYADEGASLIHVVDLDGARRGEFHNLGVVEEIAAKTGAEVQAGGGMRADADFRQLINCGVARVVVGSMAVREPATVGHWIREFGSDRVCVALDVKPHLSGEYFLTTSGWTETHQNSLWQGIDSLRGAGAKHLLCTDVGRDGTMEGPNAGLYRDLATRRPELRVQASGGVRSLEDLRGLAETGAASAIVGTALLKGAFTLPEALAL